jgi:hypothetical protein
MASNTFGDFPASPLSANLLSDLQVKQAEAADKPYYLADGRGLFLYVSNAGSKLRRLRCR